jgi:hypothetical protein
MRHVQLLEIGVEGRNLCGEEANICVLLISHVIIPLVTNRVSLPDATARFKSLF